MVDNWEVVEYKPEHAMKIMEMNLRDKEDWLRGIEVEKWFYTWRDGGPAYTLMVDDSPIACAGVILQGWNRGEAWSLLSTLFYQHKIKTYRLIKSGLDNIILENELRRVQTFIDAEFPASIDFIECLGFALEGRLRAYGPHGEDYLLYSRIK